MPSTHSRAGGAQDTRDILGRLASRYEFHLRMPMHQSIPGRMYGPEGKCRMDGCRADLQEDSSVSFRRACARLLNTFVAMCTDSAKGTRPLGRVHTGLKQALAVEAADPAPVPPLTHHLACSHRLATLLTQVFESAVYDLLKSKHPEYKFRWINKMIDFGAPYDIIGVPESDDGDLPVRLIDVKSCVLTQMQRNDHAAQLPNSKIKLMLTNWLIHHLMRNRPACRDEPLVEVVWVVWTCGSI